MGDRSKIEWTDATWNPVTGCSKVSQGCKFCYAERVFPRPYPGRDFTDVRCHPERLEQPLKWKRPRSIFVNSMSDLFHEAVPKEFLWAVFLTMAAASQHTFQVLTKRPHRMMEYLSLPGWAKEAEGNYFPWPLRNVWLGVSVEDQKTTDERIPLLLKTPAAVRFVSYEPALGPVTFRWAKWDNWNDADGNPRPCVDEHDGLRMLDWVIAGGESGPHARPAHPDWFRSVRDECQAAGVPFFFKQWGEWCSSGQTTYDRVAIGDEKAYHHWAPGNSVSVKIGKKLAGRLLDGREWNEFPEVKK